jgi:hypothetical protein
LGAAASDTGVADGWESIVSDQIMPSERMDDARGSREVRLAFL